MPKEGLFIESVDDFPHSSVPDDKRRGAINQSLIWMGYSIWPGGLLAGGIIALGLPVYEAIGATLVGCLILFLLHLLQGTMGRRTGLGIATLYGETWGKWGRLIPAGLIGIALWGWFGVVTGLVGEWFFDLVGVGTIWIYVIFFGALFAANTIFGWKGLAWIAVIGTPTILAIAIWAVPIAIGQGGGWAAIVAATPVTTMTWGAAIGITIANWAVGTAAAPDFYRWTKNARGVSSGAVAGMIIGNGGTMIIGIILAAGTGSFDLLSVFAKLGLFAVAIWFLIAGIWTSAQNNLYAASLEFSNLFGIRRLWTAIAAAVAGTTFAGLGLYGAFTNWLLALGVVFPAIIGVAIADYWVKHKGSYADVDFSRVPHAFAFNAVIAWAVGVAMEWWLGTLHLGVQCLNGLVIAFVLYVGLTYVLPNFKIASRS